ncbi:amino acid ABC transporter ATP-binding protein [Candidatus Njordibacter sp. Uisw_056]|jgi:ABC-type polar amino acid transport system ATPase subunit|uniref:amino acid ABC transporter ATP-binding protein n=1 Tax=Candidatus Njordibacter sp. Uisw_056 TaxID=3230973 RepID=UPI003D436AD2
MTSVHSRVVINMQGVDKLFGDFKALDSVSLQVHEGEKMVICGPSGSGKSTLIRSINGLEDIQAGEVSIAQVEVDGSRDARIGMVFQQFNLFPHLTVMQNLTLGPMRVSKLSRLDAEARARACLERVQIPEQADKLPRQLSGGQQQRVAIARSLCMEPDIILFDEPTSALDPEMINEVLEVMVGLADSGITMICVTHEMGFAKRVADTMVFMDGGKIVEQSPPEKFFNAPESLRCQQFLAKILHH